MRFPSSQGLQSRDQTGTAKVSHRVLDGEVEVRNGLGQGEPADGAELPVGARPVLRFLFHSREIGPVLPDEGDLNEGNLGLVGGEVAFIQEELRIGGAELGTGLPEGALPVTLPILPDSPGDAPDSRGFRGPLSKKDLSTLGGRVEEEEPRALILVHLHLTSSRNGKTAPIIL